LHVIKKNELVASGSKMKLF